MTLNKITCPCCKGKGKYKAELSYGADEVLCDFCSFTGYLYIEVSALMFYRHHCKTFAELKAKLNLHKGEMKKHRRDAESIQRYLERQNAK